MGKGNIGNAQIEQFVEQVCEKFNDQRKQYELQQTDAEDLKELKQLEEKIKNK